MFFGNEDVLRPAVQQKISLLYNINRSNAGIMEQIILVRHFHNFKTKLSLASN